METLTILAQVNYVLLVVVWAVIIVLYLRELRNPGIADGALKVLLVVLLIDALRNLFESAYFGLSRLALDGLLPTDVAAVLLEPRHVLVPKLASLGVAVLILTLLARRFVPILSAERAQRERRIADQERQLRSQRAVEAALREEKRRAETYLNIAEVMFIALDRDGRVVLANRKASEVLGDSAEELTGSDWFERLPASERSEVRGIFESIIRTGGLASPEYENDVLTRTGERRTIHWRNTAVRDDRGTIVGTLSSGEDVTDRRRAERQLQHLAHHLERILHAAGEGIVGLDEFGVITFANPAAVAILGRPETILVGLDCREIVRDSTSGDRSANSTFEAVLTQDTVVRRPDALFRRPGGGTFPAEFVAAPIRENGVITGAVLVFKDVTERRAVEESLRRSNMELRQFAYVASHDLREPLRTIVSYLQLLEMKSGERLDSNARQYLDFAVDGALRMDRLIHDLLEYSRVVGSRRERRWKPVDLNGLLKRVLDNLSAKIEAQDADVVVTDMPGVMGDETALQSLFQNLIVNALKYQASGSRARVRVSAETSPSGVLLRVVDNGIGIDPTYRERIFGIFQRLHQTDEYEGTGIGLAVCRRVVELHGGRIWIEEAPGGGSIFNIELPTSARVGGGAGPE